MTIDTPLTTNRDQLRASHALECIQGLKKEGNYGKYVSYVNGLPASILTNGLGQALAMERASDQPGHDQLYDHVNGWLCHGEHGIWKNSDDVLEIMVRSPEQTYLRAQREALEFLRWLKKLARAYLEKS